MSTALHKKRHVATLYTHMERGSCSLYLNQTAESFLYSYLQIAKITSCVCYLDASQSWDSGRHAVTCANAPVWRIFECRNEEYAGCSTCISKKRGNRLVLERVSYLFCSSVHTHTFKACCFPNSAMWFLSISCSQSMLYIYVFYFFLCSQSFIFFVLLLLLL